MFSIYAVTGASSDATIHSHNDALFTDIFEVCSQFGDIPIVLAGDLQNEPLQYDSISHAINFLHWSDPLMSIDEDGEITRPLTYSHEGTFSGAGDHNSSIDALLMNKVATAALRDIHVVQLDNLQHRPIRAVFEWHKITQTGFVHIKTAPMLCSDVPYPGKTHGTCPISQAAENFWQDNYGLAFDPHDSEKAWETINNFCVDVLVQNGAKWGQGPRERGKAPKFQEKTICPGQLPTGVVRTCHMQKTMKTLSMLNELSHRLRRHSLKPADWHETRVLCSKTWQRIRDSDNLLAWQKYACPTLDIVDENIRRLKEEIQLKEREAKNNRILMWRQKVKASAKGTKAYIFLHLKNKVQEDPPNLIVDRQGNTLYQPNEAICEINSQWDDIFAANVLRSDPIDVLRVIWPYVSHECHKIDDIELTAAELFATVQQRRTTAAPGLDGWRTEELQRLPVACFEPVVAYFKAIENNASALAKTLTCAKQVLLNKNGLAEPMHKRIITIMPALTLAYTGTRFRQLQSWQAYALPKTILGAVSGRSMATIATSIRLDIDHADVHDDAVVGIKLDKSKCFDRINPDYAATLFLTFGIPSGIIAFFLKVYKGLRRHMFYKSWTTPRYTTTANGVAQGCSLSLLAVNLYAKVWACMMQRLPEVSYAAFIDDSYIWVRLNNIHILQQALQVTELWDLLSGQQFNHGKSKLFASSAIARQQAKNLFPAIECCLEVDVLGTLLYTSRRKSFKFPTEKVNKILKDAHNIAILPVPTETKAALAGMKIIPQCTFAAGLSKITKRDLGKIQAAIVNILWHGKPNWRAKWLVFALIGQPHRLEPNLARAYTAIVDFLRFLAEHPDWHDRIVAQVRLTQPPPHSLIAGFRNALKVFDFELTCDGRLTYKGVISTSIFQLDYRDFKDTLSMLAKDYCYQNANNLHRKDFVRTEGVFDYDLTSHMLRVKPSNQQEGIPDHLFLLNHMVGCSSTKDRLTAAGHMDDPQCRFCGSEKESIPHLLRECNQMAETFGSVPSHELGANFVTLGLVEHPFPIAKYRLQVNTELPPVPTNIDTLVRKKCWIDGSLFWGKTFWLQIGGFAIVDDRAEIRKSGHIKHWSLSSYTVELWATVNALATADTGLIIFCDNKTVVQQFLWCAQNRKLPPGCRHPCWWKYILRILEIYDAEMKEVFQMHWIPGHVLPNLTTEQITQQMAQAKGTEKHHIFLNRCADAEAKRQAILAAAVHPTDEKWLRSAIDQTHQRLTLIGKRLSSDVESFKLQSKGVQQREDEHQQIPTVERVRDAYPQWLWSANLRYFHWRMHDVFPDQPLDKWPLTDADWTALTKFFSQCKWCQRHDVSVSFVELACLFMVRGFTCSNALDETASFRQVVEQLRKAMCFLKNNNYQLFPGEWNRCKNKNNGKALPAGAIEACIPYMTDHEMTVFGRMLLAGGGKNLKSWMFSIPDVKEFMHF